MKIIDKSLIFLSFLGKIVILLKWGQVLLFRGMDSRFRGNDIKRGGNDIKRGGNDIKGNGNDRGGKFFEIFFKIFVAIGREVR